MKRLLLALLLIAAGTAAHAQSFVQWQLNGTNLQVRGRDGLWATVGVPAAGAFTVTATGSGLTIGNPITGSCTNGFLLYNNAGTLGCVAPAGAGTVTSVAMAMPANLLSVTGSPVTAAGTLTGTLIVQNVNSVFAGPATGGSAAPTFRPLVAADMPGGIGTVSSVAMTVPSSLLAVSGSPVTTAGTLAVTLPTQTINKVFAGPITGAAAAPAFRALDVLDMPPGTGTITSVGLALPASVFSISGSPLVSGAGTLTGAFVTQTANTIFAGPTAGGAAVPAFRAAVTADMPLFTQTGTGAVARSYAAKNNDRVSVKDFLTAGQPDGTTDNRAQIQAAIDSVGIGGSVFFPDASGSKYCVKSGTLNVSAFGVTLYGTNREGGSIISTCAVDQTAITMTGQHAELRNLKIEGSETVATVNPAISANTGCQECTLDNVWVIGGSNGLAADAYEIYVYNSKFQFQYGTASIYLKNTGGYIWRTKFDQPYPAFTPARFINIAPRATTTAYATGAMVTSGGFVLQATVGGTSGSGAITVPTYYTSVTDGTVTWKLSSRTEYHGIQVDTGSGASLYIKDSDFSSVFSSPIITTNTLAGTPPIYIEIMHNTFGSFRDIGIDLSAGGLVKIQDNTLGSCLVTGCSGIWPQNAFIGDLIISGNHILGVAAGITLYSGANTQIVDNQITDNITGISVGAGVSNWIAVGNTIGPSAVYGAPAGTTGVYVAPGASDHYIIARNNLVGNVTPINDGGTGTDKIIWPNLPLTPLPLWVRTIAQTLAMTCNASRRGQEVYVSDTVGVAAPAFGGAVAGGGATAVNRAATCNGTTWVY